MIYYVHGVDFCDEIYKNICFKFILNYDDSELKLKVLNKMFEFELKNLEFVSFEIELINNKIVVQYKNIDSKTETIEIDIPEELKNEIMFDKDLVLKLLKDLVDRNQSDLKRFGNVLLFYTLSDNKISIYTNN